LTEKQAMLPKKKLKTESSPLLSERSCSALTPKIASPFHVSVTEPTRIQSLSVPAEAKLWNVVMVVTTVGGAGAGNEGEYYASCGTHSIIIYCTFMFLKKI
jgi:hypothetical protein